MPILLGPMEDSTGKFKFDFEEPGSSEEYTRKYLVLSDSIDQDEIEIVNTPGIPLRFSRIGRGVCIDHEVKAEERIAKNPRTNAPCMLYVVTCKFTSSLGEEDIPAGSSTTPFDPLEHRPKVSWKSRIEEKVITKDLDGQVIETRAHEPIILTSPKVIPILTVKKIEAWPYPPNRIFDYTGATNLTKFYGAPEGTVLVTSITADETVINGKLYTDVTYEIEFDIEIISDYRDIEPGYGMGAIKRNTRIQSVLNNGTQYIPDFGLKPVRFIDTNGVPQRVNLDNLGFLLPSTSDPYYLKFKTIKPMELNDLNLGPYDGSS